MKSTKTTRAATKRALITGIRFQLDQLSAQNAHHEFEHLCRQFARERIASNILPATGPVTSGGDQGRDFETFLTFVRSKKSDSSLFAGVAESQTLVFACSLTKREQVRAKVKADVKEICENSTPHIIYFFSSQGVPIAWRHKLQSWCIETYSCRLEIIDAEALAEQLSDSSLFWIAEEYLHVPAELFPLPTIGIESAYERVRQRWIEEAQIPYNYSDFGEVKLGIRKATFNDELKSDLSGWIRVMEYFLTAGRENELQRRATYEICVAALRGLHDLTKRRYLVERYFRDWSAETGLVEIKDATVLLSYASSALLHGEFEIERNQLHQWSVALVGLIDEEIKSAVGPNIMAELLYARSYASQLSFLKSEDPYIDQSEIFDWWFKTVAAAAKAPLFSIDAFADLLTVMVPFLGEDPRFQEVSQRVDALLAKRAMGYVIAEKARDRAIALMEAGKTIAAIEQLHQAKLNWFTGDAIEETVLTMLALSDAYLKLGLVWAAKYHALAAAFVVITSNSEGIKRRLVDALGQVGVCQYVGGEWLSFSEFFPIFFVAHYRHQSDPDDWGNHIGMQQAVLHFLVAKSFGKPLGGKSLVGLIEAPFRKMDAPQDLKDEVLNASLPLEKYEAMEPSEIMKLAAAEFWGAPFSDSGPKRAYRWRALGIDWIATCKNLKHVVPYAEEFIAILQITLADLSRVDLCLLPTTVALEISVENIDVVGFEDVPANSVASFKVNLRGTREKGELEVDKAQGEVVGIAASVLIACSCLPEKEVHAVIKSALSKNLANKAFLARPYFELWQEFSVADDFDERRSEDLNNPELPPFELRESAELHWISTPGIGYSKKKATEFLENRYRRGLMPIRKTLAKLNASDRFKKWVRALRSEGYLDWQILLRVGNAVINHWANSQGIQANLEKTQELFLSRLNRDEEDDDLQFPEEFLYSEHAEMAKSTMLASNAKVWGLVVRRQTPDFVALKKLLDVRYFQSTDDVAHAEIFDV